MPGRQFQRKADGYLRTGGEPLYELTSRLIAETKWEEAEKICQHIERVVGAVHLLLQTRHTVSHRAAWQWVARFFRVGNAMDWPKGERPIAQDVAVAAACESLMQYFERDTSACRIVYSLFHRSAEGFGLSEGLPPSIIRRNIFEVVQDISASYDFSFASFSRMASLLKQACVNSVTLKGGGQAWLVPCGFLKIANNDAILSDALRTAFDRAAGDSR